MWPSLMESLKYSLQRYRTVHSYHTIQFKSSAPPYFSKYQAYIENTRTPVWKARMGQRKKQKSVVYSDVMVQPKRGRRQRMRANSLDLNTNQRYRKKSSKNSQDNYLHHKCWLDSQGDQHTGHVFAPVPGSLTHTLRVHAELVCLSGNSIKTSQVKQFL